MKIHGEIQQMKRQLTGESRRDLKKAARNLNVTEDSLIWLMADVFQSGHIRSRAYADCPEYVILDGLVEEGKSGMLLYTPWRFTQKAKDILKARQP